MITRLFATFSALLAALLVFAGCTNDPVSRTGGTETGDAVVVGTLYRADGKTPAAGVRVAIRPGNALADTAGFALGKRMADTASVITDSAGRYSFDSTLDTGTYVIEATSGNDAVFIDSVAVTSKDSIDSLPADTLKPAGALKGVVKLSEGGDPRKVFVLAFGIDRFARVEADGSFRFSRLAEGMYDLRLISSLDDYGVVDTPNVEVTAAETTDVKTIELPFTGIPTVRGLMLSYDTLKQIVTLSWGMADSALMKGFNVYRRNVDSNSVLKQVNTSPITDTVYRDSTGIQEQTYEYRVAAVDKNATEGTKSAGVGVKMVVAFRFVKNFGQQGSGAGQFIGANDIAIDSQGNYWVVDYNKNKVMNFDPSGTFILEWDASGFVLGLHSPVGLDIDTHKNIYLSGWSGNSIQKYDSTGNLIFRIDSSGISSNDVSVDEKGYIYFGFAPASGNTKYIAKCNPDGTFNKTWAINSMYLGNAILARNGKVYCAGASDISGQSYADVVVEVFDTAGVALNAIHIRKSGETGAIDIRDIDMDNKGRLYASDPENGKIRIFDEINGLITQFGVKGSGTDQFSSIRGIAVSPNKTIAITDMSEVHIFDLP